VKDLQTVRSFVQVFLELVIDRLLEIFMKIPVANYCHLGCDAPQVHSSTFKMEAVLYSETLVTIYQSAGVTFQRTVIFIVTAARTSYLDSYLLFDVEFCHKCACRFYMKHPFDC
jgi:hypothetical protein